jgi:hypothetical protein
MISIADIDGDGRPDVVTMSDKQTLRWYRIPKIRDPWERHDIGQASMPELPWATSTARRPDVVRSNVWFENAA